MMMPGAASKLAINERSGSWHGTGWKEAPARRGLASGSPGGPSADTSQEGEGSGPAGAEANRLAPTPAPTRPASGYYDLATANFANAYMLHHSGIDPARVTIRNYPAGHMMYLNQGSLEQLSKDIGEFIQGK